MADQRSTALFRLVESKLGGSLVEYLRAAREADKPFHVIGYELVVKTGESVTPETIRRWVRSLEEAGDLPPSTIPGHRKVA